MAWLVFSLSSLILLTLDKLHDRLTRFQREEKRRQEKKIRNQIDDLRHALKKLEPEIGPDATYEEVRSDCHSRLCLFGPRSLFLPFPSYQSSKLLTKRSIVEQPLTSIYSE